MRRKKSFGQGEDVTNINISPLIDMVFILLIFFIVTTVFVEEKGLGAQTPDPVPPIEQEEDDQDKLSLLIKKTGQVIAQFGAKSTDIGLGGVRGRVQQEKNRLNEDDFSLLVNVEPDSLVDLYVQVHDMCILAGANTITMKVVDKE